MKSKNIKNKIIPLIAALFLSVFTLFSCLFPVRANNARAEGSRTFGYMTTTIEEDLKELDVETYLYPQNAFGTHEVIRLVEFCYSDNSEWNQYYDLYFYVYNPIAKKLSHEGNVVNMAVAYDEEGKPSSYENVPLTYCDATDDCRFYKFKLSAPQRFFSLEQGYEKSFKVRRYDIAGMKLELYIGATVNDASQGFTYYYAGYGKGLGAGAENKSTLTCQKIDLETITLDVGHTNYRTEIFGEDNICESVDTVYFSVDESYFQDYGGLQKIKAEWYEYKTSPIFVTSDADAYNALSEYVGKDIGEQYDALDWRILWDIAEYSRNATGQTGADVYYRDINGVFNKRNEFPVEIPGRLNTYKEECNIVTQLDWLFFAKNVNSRKDYIIDIETLNSWMESYAKEYTSSGLILDRYANELFAESIDEARQKYLKDYENGATSGYVLQEIDANEKESLTSIKDLSFWDKFLGESWKQEIEYNPIVVIGKEDIAGLNSSTFADKYMINENDRIEIFDKCKMAVNEGKRFVLFRFAKTDYYASTARFDKISAFGESGYYISNNDGYVAQQTVFLDFDVISLTFRNEHDVDTVIGVAANPIDIINAVTPPSDLNPPFNILADWNPFDGISKEEVIGLIIAAVLIIVILTFVLFVAAPEVFEMIIHAIGKFFRWIGSGIKKGAKKIGDSAKRVSKANSKRKKAKKGTAKKTKGAKKKPAKKITKKQKNSKRGKKVKARKK